MWVYQRVTHSRYDPSTDGHHCGWSGPDHSDGDSRCGAAGDSGTYRSLGSSFKPLGWIKPWKIWIKYGIHMDLYASSDDFMGFHRGFHGILLGKDLELGAFIFPTKTELKDELFDQTNQPKPTHWCCWICWCLSIPRESTHVWDFDGFSCFSGSSFKSYQYSWSTVKR